MSRHNQVNTSELKPTRSAPMAGSSPSHATTSTATTSSGWIDGLRLRPRNSHTPRRSTSPGSSSAERMASISSANESALSPA